MANLLDRLMSRVIVTDSCWLFAGTKTKGGYGRISLSGRLQLAHRASYELRVGKIPDGKFVCHKCDVPSCVNPAHLFLGTQSENVRDMISKGRRHKTKLFGEKHPGAKLSSKQVAEIRTLAASLSQAEIARKFSVNASTISYIISGKSRTND